MDGDKTTKEPMNNEPVQDMTEPAGAAEAAAPEAETMPAEKTASGHTGKIVLAVVVVVILGVLAWAGMQLGAKDEAAIGNGEISFDTSVQMPSFDNVPDVVAKVDGVELTKQDYIETYTQSWQMMSQQGVAMNDPAAQASLVAQVMDVLVNAELLAQAATASGVVVSDEAVAEEVNSLANQFGGEAGLNEALTEVGMSADMLRDNIAEQILIETYLGNNSAASGVITDADVQARYDEVAAQSTADLPPFEEVADIIKMQLEAEAEQAATNAVVEGLRADAEVELYMDLQEV